jgi:hypothetical protein
MNKEIIAKLPTDAIPGVENESQNEEVGTTTKEVTAGEEELRFSVPEEGITLASLPLTNAQKKALEAAGVDVSTFVMTKGMLECGIREIGEDRIEALATGGAPTFLEVTKLLPCITAS